MPPSDSERVPDEPSVEEAELTASLGADALRSIDERLLQVSTRRLKVARIIADAMELGGYSLTMEACFHLHVRRVVALVKDGALEVWGDPLIPRWSEARRKSSD